MTRENEKKLQERLVAIVSETIERRARGKEPISPISVATEALLEIDPQGEMQRENPIAYIAIRIALREIARRILRERFELEPGREAALRHVAAPEAWWRQKDPPEA